MSKLKKGELLEWLDRQIKYIKENIKEQEELAPESIDLWQEKDEQAYQQIKSTLAKFDEECVKSFEVGYKAGVIESASKPEVTEEWIEEKAKKLRQQTYIAEPIHGYGLDLDIAKDFIRSLMEEIHERK